MAYSQTLIDNFDDNTINLTKWTLIDGAGITESGGKLNVPAQSVYPQALSQALYNLENGILAAKLTRSGTATAETEFYFGAHDSTGTNMVGILATPSTNFWEFVTYGAAATSSEVLTDTVGVGSSWVNNTWIGVGNLGSDNILYAYKSSDGVTWTEMGHCTVGGTFGKSSTGLDITVGVYSGSSTFVAQFDDASFWSEATTPSAKVRVGGSWVNAH